MTWLAVIWLVFTLSLVLWWWIHALLQSAASESAHRMYFWEGASLISVLTLGGVALVVLTSAHQRRHERLKIFFSTFAHDLRTSMTRLRLQAELLEESSMASDPKLKAILRDIQRLDFQLENSLWMSQLENSPLLSQKTRLRDVMEHLRNEFHEIRFELSSDAELWVDRRAFTVVLRNLFHNSLLHAQADQIEIRVEGEKAGRLKILISDNGQAQPSVSAKQKNLGQDLLSSTSRGTGLGLYLSRRLVERMKGELEIQSQPRFLNVLTIPGSRT